MPTFRLSNLSIIWGLLVMASYAYGQPVITSQPQSETVALGSPFNFSVSVDPASIDSNVTYQWYAFGAPDGGLGRGGGAISSVGFSYTTWDMASTYYVVISDNGYSVTSQSATLTITGVVAPTITTQPADQTVVPGGQADTYLTATGTLPFYYQWYFNGAPVYSTAQYSPTANIPFTLTEASTSNVGSYYCVAWNSAGTVTSNLVNISLSQLPLPVIIGQPLDVTGQVGDDVQLSVNASIPGQGEYDPTYQWYFNGNPIAGATVGTLILYPLSLAQAGSYTVTVTDSTGSVTSNSATVTVTSLLNVAITTQPVSQSSALGTNVVLGVTATGTDPITYSWTKNQTSTVVGTTASLTLNDIQASDQGLYICSVQNGFSAANSTAVTLTIPSAGVNPTLIAGPGPQQGIVGGTASFSVYAVAAGNLTYQWYLNGVAIPNASQPNLSFAVLTTANAGNYSVEVTSPYGSTLSSAATLTVSSTGLPTPTPTPTASGTAPTPTPTPIPTPTPTPKTNAPTPSLPVGTFVQPQGQVVAPGSTVTFSVGAPQNGVEYQWYYNGSPLADTTSATGRLSERAGTGGDTISGAGSARVLINGATASADGSYSCQITGSSGSVMSAAATLQISSTSNPGRITNISCRSEVGTGANILIAGFAVGGSGVTGDEPLLMRASGPALSTFGVTGVLSDPALALFNAADSKLSSDSGWAGDTEAITLGAKVGAFAWTNPASADSALVSSLAPGAYTAQVDGASGDTGVSLVEVYDGTPGSSYTTSSPRLVNISARVEVGTGANILIAGFVIGGSTSKTVLIRASGPALTPFGVSDVLAKPALGLYNSSAVEIASNTGWQADPQLSQVAASVGAFPWGGTATPDSALLVTLAPGAYTAQVQGADGGTGVALVEVYEVP